MLFLITLVLGTAETWAVLGSPLPLELDVDRLT